MSTTAPCERCGSEIDHETTRCPDCGYEPSDLLRAKLVALLALPVFVASTSIVVSGSLVTPVFVYSPSAEAIQAIAVPSILASAAVLFGYYRRGERKPTDSTVF